MILFYFYCVLILRGKTLFVKNYLKISTVLFFCFFLLGSFSVFSHTSEQANQFFNKTNIAIYKCQKEISQSDFINFNEKYQSTLKLESIYCYDSKNYILSFAYSNACKKHCLELLAKLNFTNTTFFDNTPKKVNIIKALPSPFTKY